MATSSTPSRRKPAAKDSAHARVVKRLCTLKETPIATPEVLALAGGDRVTSSEVMQAALKLTDASEVMQAALKLTDALVHEAQQVSAARQRLIDLPAAQRPLRTLL